MAYVYGHYKADTNELFYIGKGTGRRAWTQQHRTKHWKNVVNKHGLIVKILEDNLTEQDALDLERKMIAEVGLTNLVNILDGGEGITSEVSRSLFLDPEIRKKYDDGMCRARIRMSEVKKQQIKNDVEYYKKLVNVLQNPKTSYKRYTKIQCNVCGMMISKNVMDRHQASSRSCKKEFNRLSLKEIEKIKAHEKYKNKIQKRR